MQKKRNLIILLIFSLILSTLAHLYFLIEWAQERYMVGPNDGLQQMVTFKKLLYEQYTSGNFFYSYNFGLGGSTYSQLAYYFSTSIVFILTSVVVYLLQSAQYIGTPDIVFWAKSAVFISVFRLALIICITTLVFRYMKCNWLAAFIGATVYGLTILYFRHATYWEFFADAMIWVPVLVFGVEKIIRTKQFGWFSFAITLTLFDNFYFAYVNLIFILIYIAFRWIIQLEANETSKWEQLKLYGFSGLIGFGISAFSFIPAVYGLYTNDRPPYKEPIPLLNWDNIFFASGYVIMPVLFLLFLFTFSLYKHHTFRFFTGASIFLIILHFSPLVASFFNGFSAPQYRWEYVLSFMMGGAVAVGIHNLKKVSKRGIWGSICLAVATYLGVSLLDPIGHIFSVPSLVIWTLLLIIITILLFYNWKRTKIWKGTFQAVVLLTTIVLANIFQWSISNVGEVKQVSKNYLLSDKYNGKEQRQLLQQVKHRDTGSLYRIDWKIKYRNNTPIVQDFNGMSVYSSILNENLLFFYLYDLEIDMGRESVSRYATLGNRANLHSMLQGKYIMREKKDKTTNIPYGFTKMLESSHYVVYKNKNLLPFVRTTNQIYLEKNIEDAPAIEKEHAMLTGVIVQGANKSYAKIPKVPNIIEETTLEAVGASYKNKKLSVTKKKGGINVIIDKPKSDTKDYYIGFHLENLAKDQGFSLKVNDYRTTRKSNQSIYKTYVDKLTIRVPKAKKIKIRLPKGNYILSELALYEENYQTLEKAKKQPSYTSRKDWIHNRLTITYHNKENHRYMMVPIPFEKGWEVFINEEKYPVQKTNFAFLGFPIKEGLNAITLVYYPPFFKLSLAISITSILITLFIFWHHFRRKRHS